MSENPVQRIVIESLPLAEPFWIDWLSGLLVPLIAIVSVWIAYQQFQVNRQRLRSETYERRLAVYKCVQKYLSEVVRQGKVSLETLRDFYASASEAAFLFDPSIQQKIDEIYDNSLKLMEAQEQLYPSDGSPGLPVGPERSAASQRKADLLAWHNQELRDCRPLFAKKLGLKVI